jgi:hypothetical protein
LRHENPNLNPNRNTELQETRTFLAINIGIDGFSDSKFIFSTHFLPPVKIYFAQHLMKILKDELQSECLKGSSLLATGYFSILQCEYTPPPEIIKSKYTPTITYPNRCGVTLKYNLNEFSRSTYIINPKKY